MHTRVRAVLALFAGASDVVIGFLGGGASPRVFGLLELELDVVVEGDARADDEHHHVDDRRGHLEDRLGRGARPRVRVLDGEDAEEPGAVDRADDLLDLGVAVVRRGDGDEAEREREEAADRAEVEDDRVPASAGVVRGARREAETFELRAARIAGIGRGARSGGRTVELRAARVLRAAANMGGIFLVEKLPGAPKMSASVSMPPPSVMRPPSSEKRCDNQVGHKRSVTSAIDLGTASFMMAST